MKTPIHGPRSGQVLILFAAAILVAAAMCVFAIDVGRLMICKAELQNAVDAASLAGASQLSGHMTQEEKQLVRAEATALAAANTVAGKPLTLADADIEFGHYDADTGSFVPELQAHVVDSIRITGRRTQDSPDGPIGLFFGPLFGWDEAELVGTVGTGTKPRRYVSFVLDRSGSMCFDTAGVQLAPYEAPQDAEGPYMETSASGWCWFPDLAMKQDKKKWQTKTAWFYARDINTGEIRTDFLPDHIQARLDAGRYFNFRPVDYPDSVRSGWIKVPAGVRIYGRYGNPWHNWQADEYYHVISDDCGYARSTGAVEPLQSSADAACAFLDLLNIDDDCASLVTYGWASNLDQMLTTDFAAVEARLQSLAPCGATAEPDAMEAANDELIASGRAEGYGQRAMILLTDGYANMLQGSSYSSSYTRTYEFLGQNVTTKIHPTVAAAMAQEALRARANGVRIYCVTFGTDVDTELHREMAMETNGAYYYAADHEGLTDIFIDIFRRLPPLLMQ